MEEIYKNKYNIIFIHWNHKDYFETSYIKLNLHLFFVTARTFSIY